MYTTSDKSMGKVLTTLTVTNRANQSAAARGFIPTEQIRSITLDNVLVDRVQLHYACQMLRSPFPRKLNSKS
jgi:uncharacterized NAD-dependent epimerase/dehydratase family protein